MDCKEKDEVVSEWAEKLCEEETETSRIVTKGAAEGTGIWTRGDIEEETNSDTNSLGEWDEQLSKTEEKSTPEI